MEDYPDLVINRVEEEEEEKEPEIESQRILTSGQKVELNRIILEFEEFEELGKIPFSRETSIMKVKLIVSEFLGFRELGVVEPSYSTYQNQMAMVERLKQGKLKLRLCMDLENWTKLQK